MEEIKAPPDIEAEDFKALVSCRTCIINNHAWLSAVGLEHEVSNTETMEKLISKLLWGQVEKWSKYFEEQEEEVKARLFEPFLRWLEMAGRLWETVLPLMQKIKEGMNPLLVVSCSG